MNAFKVKVDDKEYNINPLIEEDQTLYEIFDTDLICVIGLNENATWEATTDIDESLVQKIGNAIEDYEA